MNVFLMLLTTVSAGANPVPAVPAAHAAPASSCSGCGTASSCGGTCGSVSDCSTSCCQPSCGKPKRARKSKDCCEVVSCAPACTTSCAPACSAPACAPASCCGAATSCQSSCEPVCCEKPKRRCIFTRRKKDCCEVISCDTCGSGCGSAVVAPTVIHSAPAMNAAPVMSAPAHNSAIINPAPLPSGAPIQSAPINVPGKSAEPIKKLPQGSGNQGASLLPLSSVTPAGAKVEESKNPFDSARRHDASVGHTANYGRLTGQLSFVRVDGGLWVLRYAPLGQEDVYGGSVILARDRQMTDFKEGDQVTVEGKVIDQKGSTRLGGPLYQVNSIRLVDRASN